MISAAGPTLAGLEAGTRRLTTLYIVALGAVAAMAIAGQYLVQQSLQQQLGDSTVVNIAGRQRMLSQRIAKCALQLQSAETTAGRAAARLELSEILPLWRQSHEALLHGDSAIGLPGRNSSAVTSMFRELQPAFETIERAARQLSDENPIESRQHVQQILNSEGLFLAGMDRIVFQYDREAHGRVAALKLTERILLLLTLTVLGAEGWLVFRPAIARLQQVAHQLQATTNDLVSAKQAAEAASAAKSRFLGNMSHELRTPLHAILAAAELAQADHEAMTQPRHLATITDAGTSLLTLVNDLLDVARIESGHLDLHLAPTDLTDLARRIVEMFAATAQQKRVLLKCDVAADLPPLLLVDEARLRQILVNLIGNALKFTDRGEVTIEIKMASGDVLECGPDSPGMARLLFLVRDTGPGIPTSEHRRIFEPFCQVDASQVRKHGGAGLGLAITARLVEKMQGQIELVSEPGSGSTFRVMIPAQVAAAAPAEEPAAPAIRKFSGLRVLIAEDSDVIRRLLEITLLERRCQVVLASDGRSALASFQPGAFDAVLVDMHMPGLNGAELVTEIRRREQQSGARPATIVALTADGMAATRELAWNAGINAFMLKPFRAAELWGALEANTTAPAPEEQSAGFPLLNEVARRCGGRLDLAHELALLMQAALEQASAEFNASLVAGDLPLLRRLAHRLRGQILQFAAPDPLVSLLLDLERYAAEGNYPGSQAIVNRLAPHVDAFANRLWNSQNMAIPVGYEG